MRAFALGRKLATTSNIEPPADLTPLLDELGLQVVAWPFVGRVREVIVEGVIGIEERLSEPWRRWLTAHAVGHHMLHTGTSLYLESWQWVSRFKAERQAEEFAAGLLTPVGAPRLFGPRAASKRWGIPETKAEWAISLAEQITERMG